MDELSGNATDGRPRGRRDLRHPPAEYDTPVKPAGRAGIATRLKRAEGHLRAVITMIEAGRLCLDLAQQLHAVEVAVRNANRALIHDYIEHCLEETNDRAGQRATLKDLKTLSKYL